MQASTRILGAGVAGGCALALALLFASRDAGPLFPGPPPEGTPRVSGPPSDAEAGSVTLADLASVLERCAPAGSCTGVAYFWSPRMPLSRAGIEEIRSAAAGLGIDATVVSAEELYAFTDDPEAGRSGPMPSVAEASPSAPSDGRLASLAKSLIRRGATTHFPSFVVYRDGELLGHAVLGYKRAKSYAGSISSRLERGGSTAPTPAASPAPPPWALGATAGEADRDYEARGNPGAYFRWVPVHNAVAYEAGQSVYLLDLDEGVSREGPGYIDFVPTPDGRFFVTPGRGGNGLEFYDASAVFQAARRGTGGGVAPVYADARMRDQYPSVGILEQSEGRTVYRVLTSWARAVVYRDYEVSDTGTGAAYTIRELGDPVPPCRDVDVSIPIMSQNGRELAGRDEATGTTKIFRLDDGGRCEALLDIGIQTGKVAWHSTGRLLAFAIARGADRNGSRLPIDGVSGRAEGGIYVLNRDTERIAFVRGSEEVSRLAFPEFVGDDSIIFLIPSDSRSSPGTFRLVDGVR